MLPVSTKIVLRCPWYCVHACPDFQTGERMESKGVFLPFFYITNLTLYVL